MLVKIPAARKPERMLDMVLPACHMAMRIGFSSLVYHEEVTANSQIQLRVSSGWCKLTEGDPGEERRFSKTDEESTDCETSTASHSRHANRRDTPSHHDGRQKPPRIRFGEPQVSGQLAD